MSTHSKDDNMPKFMKLRIQAVIFLTAGILLIYPTFFLAHNLFNNNAVSNFLGGPLLKLQGKFIDQNGNAINNVTISFSITKYSRTNNILLTPTNNFVIITDTDGTFRVKGHGYKISIISVKKEGYEFIQDEHTSRLFDTRNGWNPNSNETILFKMRKKGTGTYLIGTAINCFSFNRSESGRQKGYDFINGMLIKEEEFSNPKINNIPLYCDLTIRATIGKSINSWKIEIIPGGKEGGILCSTELLYAAPLSGYSSKYVFESVAFCQKFGLKEWWEQYHYLYFYIRSRDPLIYTRITVAALRSDEKGFSLITYACVVNPFGDVNLELADNLPFQVMHRIELDIFMAYNQGEPIRPAKPDLQSMLIEQSK